MIFYIHPPLLDIPLDLLQDICCKRMALLMKINLSEGDVETIREILEWDDTCHECLHEGTMEDLVSHFVVRSLLVTQQSALERVTRAEAMLFRYRFERLSWDEKLRILRHIHSEVRSTLGCKLVREYRSVLETLTSVLDTMFSKWDDISYDRDFEVQVPFEHALSLVSSRSVTLKKGVATVTAPFLGELLTCLFEETLHQGIDHFGRSANFRRLFQDERMAHLGNILQGLFNRRYPRHMPEGQLPLHWSQVAAESFWFPPCMAKVYALLLRENRLPHEDRAIHVLSSRPPQFCFSLFLKELGLPLAESLVFWEHFYSRRAGHGASCAHEWQKDGRQLRYSVRHMYGLEGARRDYTAHSCLRLQDRDYCPFKPGVVRTDPTFGIDAELSAADIEDLAQLCQDGRATAACKLHMLHSARSACPEFLQDAGLTNMDIDDDEGPSVHFEKPSQYYYSFKHLVNELRKQCDPDIK
ncbi:unnamed protein product [Ixodes hexagonus]